MATLIVAISTYARDFEYQGLTYTVISESDKTCQTKVGYLDDDWNWHPGDDISGELVIPATVSDGAAHYTVIKIGAQSFSYCNNLTDVTIPNSVTEIDDNAFESCTNLTAINLKPSITHIGNAAFATCSSLTQIDIPESVLHIGIAAFSNCHQLKSANLPPNITEISDYIFCACSQLNGIHIPESVTKIGLGAFLSCSSLTSINIPASVTEIDLFAFDECTALTAVHAESVESWCKIDFYEKGSNPLSNAHNMYVNGELIHNIVIPNSITQINDHAFAEFSSMESIEIPNSVTQIGEEAFVGCSNLISVTIPGSVTTIDTNAFAFCNHMTQLTIGDLVSEIQNGAFGCCPELTDIYSLNTTPPNIYEYTFDEESSATLHIKPEALNAYRAHAYWRRFKIMADLSSGINEIIDNATINESALPMFYYNLHGQPTDPDNLHPGQLYIRHQGNKSTKIIAR